MGNGLCGSASFVNEVSLGWVQLEKVGKISRVVPVSELVSKEKDWVNSERREAKAGGSTEKHLDANKHFG